MSSLLKTLPLILYTVSLVTSLPIISKPLENNPDHLVWEALLTIDTRNIEPDKTRKVPKSIFITPNLNESKAPCPTGHKLGPDGKCYKTLNIDPLDILKTQIASLFNRNRTTVEYDEYDYNDYSESTESMSSDGADAIERYDVPLSLGFADDQSPFSSRVPTRVVKDESRIVLGINYDDEKYKQPFLVSTVDVATNGALKSYNVHTEKSAIAERSSTDTSSTMPISITPTSILSASITNGDSSTKRKETTTDTDATDAETTAVTTASKHESTKSSLSTIYSTHEAIAESLNSASDVFSTIPTTAKSNNSVTPSKSSSTNENENVTPTFEIKTETVPNLQILNAIILNGKDEMNVGTKPKFVADNAEESADSPKKVEDLPFSTEVHFSSESSTVTEADSATLAETTGDDIAGSTSSPTSQYNFSWSIHRFSILTTATSGSINEDNSSGGNSSSLTSSAPSVSNQKFDALSGDIIRINSFDSEHTSSTASYNETNLTPSINHMLGVDVDNSSSSNQVENSTTSEDVREIEIVQRDDTFPLEGGIDNDVNNRNDATESQNFTARLAEESLFQGNRVVLDSISIASQMDTLGDVIATTEEPLYVDTTENQHQLNVDSEEFVVVTPIFDDSDDKNRDKASIPDEIADETNQETSPIYTAFINTLKQNRRTFNGNDDKDGMVIVETGNSNDDMYRINAPTNNENGDKNENTPIVPDPKIKKHSATNADSAQIETDHTIRLGKNCYLKNYLEHYYIMCT